MKAYTFAVVFESGESRKSVNIQRRLGRTVNLLLSEYFVESANAGPLVVQFEEGVFQPSETNSLRQDGFLLNYTTGGFFHQYDHGRLVSEAQTSGRNRFTFQLRNTDGSVPTFTRVVLHFTTWELPETWDGAKVETDKALLHRLAGITRRTDRWYDPDMWGRTVPGLIDSVANSDGLY